VISKSLSRTLVLVALAITPAAFAKELPDRARHPSAQTYTAAETATLGAAADRKAEAQQRRWDRRLNLISGSICKGC
jgi:hypothetical protein